MTGAPAAAVAGRRDPPYDTTRMAEVMAAYVNHKRRQRVADFDDLLRLAAGQSARLTAVGLSGSFGGTVRLVEPAIDAATRLGRARITLDDPQDLRAGMFVEAEIYVAERDTLAVPVTAVDAHFNDEAFSDAVTAAARRLLAAR